jgi:hypothetical protein
VLPQLGHQLISYPRLGKVFVGSSILLKDASKDATVNSAITALFVVARIIQVPNIIQTGVIVILLDQVGEILIVSIISVSKQL